MWKSQAGHGHDFRQGACYHSQLNASTLGRRNKSEESAENRKKPNKNVELKV